MHHLLIAGLAAAYLGCAVVAGFALADLTRVAGRVR